MIILLAVNSLFSDRVGLLVSGYVANKAMEKKLNDHLVKLCLETWRSHLTQTSIPNILLMLTLSTGVV